MSKLLKLTGIISLLICIFGKAEKVEYVINFGTKEKKIEFIERIRLTKNKVYLPEIAKLLEDSDEEVRVKASLTLYEIGDSTCIDFYRKALSDSYWQVRLYGIKGLVKFGEGDIIPDLINFLKDPYWQIRYYSAIGLGKYGNEDVIKVLIDNLNDKSLKVKEAILISLKKLMWKNIAREKFKSLSESELQPVFDCFNGSEKIKLLAISLFENSNDKRVIPYLVKLLGDESDEVKIKSLWALERFKSSNIEEIEGLLSEASVKVKIEAIKTLVRLKGEEGIEGLIKGLSDENENVRLYSLWALEKFRNPSSYPEIVNCLNDSSQIVREETINLIERLNDPLMIYPLQAFINDKKNPVESRMIALIELGIIGQNDLENVKEFLKECLKSEEKEIRYAAIESFYYLDKFDDYYIKNLVYMEKNDPYLRIRKESSRIISEIIKEAINSINSPIKQEREFMLKKVENFVGSDQVNKLLLKMFYSKYPEVREKFAFLVKENPNKIFSRNIRELMKEPDIEIKKLCAMAIGEMEDKNAISLLKQGLKSVDPEYQLICAWALAKMKREDGIEIILKNLDNEEINLQKLAVESLAFLEKNFYSHFLLKKLYQSEIDVKLIAAWGLAKIGEIKGLEVLVRFSETNIEPIRTLANKYLQDKKIPLSLRSKIPEIREEIYRNKLGVQEIIPKIIYSYKTDLPIDLDGEENESIWKMIEKENKFIVLGDEKTPIDIQTKVASVYDDENIYFLFICEMPSNKIPDLESRDFITISLNPKNSFNEWYQFVFHPLNPLQDINSPYIKYCYIWKLYKDEEPEKLWTSNWQVFSKIKGNRYVVEVSIPLKDLKVEKIKDNIQWYINFHREIDDYKASTWTGRIDQPEQFGVIIFKENL